MAKSGTEPRYCVTAAHPNEPRLLLARDPWARTNRLPIRIIQSPSQSVMERAPFSFSARRRPFSLYIDRFDLRFLKISPVLQDGEKKTVMPHFGLGLQPVVTDR